MAAPKMKWSFDMKLLLDELFSDTHSDLSPTQRCQAFNEVFADDIRDFGFTEGVPYRRLTVQYNEKKKPNVPKDWMKIATPTNAQQARRQALRVQIDGVLHAGSAVVQPPPPRKASTSNGKKRLADPDETSMPLSKRLAVATWKPVTPQSLPTSGGFAVSKTSSTANRRLALLPPATKAAKSPKVRPDGTTIVTAGSPRRYAPPVSQHLAQPPLPELLFRFWLEVPDSDRDSRNGFWSRRHHNKNCLSSTPPAASSLDATDILDHMDRKPVDTPFISTFSRLIWGSQQLLTLLKKHGQEVHMSVINVKALDKRSVFWARPFHDEVRQSYGFTQGAGNYRGTHEFLIWGNIPAAAVVHTFRGQDLVNLAAQPGIRELLRFDTLRGRESLSRKVAILKNLSVRLTPAIVDAMAVVVSFFGIRASRDPGHISAVVTGLCEGWGLQIRRRDEQEWQYLANHFTDHFCSRDQSIVVGFKQRQIIKLAFLDGVAWGCGDANARHTTAGIARKVKIATTVGLACPADILAHEMDGIKLALKLSEKTEQQRLLKYHSQARNQLLYDEDARDMDMSEHEEPNHHTPAMDEDLEGPVVTSDEEEIMFDPEEADDVFMWG